MRLGPGISLIAALLAGCGAGASPPVRPADPTSYASSDHYGSPPGRPAEPEERADPELERAAELFQSALDAFVREEYALALAQFRGAYSIRPAPEILYNIGVCEERLGNTSEAVGAFRRYLDESESDTNPAIRREVERRILDLARNPPEPVE